MALATLGKFPWRKVPLYLLAQYIGAFLGSLIVFLVYWEAIVFYEHDRGGYRVTPDTAAIFGTFPGHHLTLWGGVTDQLVATAILLLCICAIQDRNNMKVSKQVIPFFIGLTILAIGVCFGYNCGYAINPARDLAPRLFSCKKIPKLISILSVNMLHASDVWLGTGRLHEALLLLVDCPRHRHSHWSYPRSLDLLSSNRYVVLTLILILTVM